MPRWPTKKVGLNFDVMMLFPGSGVVNLHQLAQKFDPYYLMNDFRFKAAMRQAGSEFAGECVASLRNFHPSYRFAGRSSFAYSNRSFESIGTYEEPNTSSMSGYSNIVGYIMAGPALMENRAQRPLNIYLSALKFGVAAGVIRSPYGHARGTLGSWAKSPSTSGNIYERLGIWGTVRGFQYNPSRKKGGEKEYMVRRRKKYARSRAMERPYVELGKVIAASMEKKGIKGGQEPFAVWYLKILQRPDMRHKATEIYRVQLLTYIADLGMKGFRIPGPTRTYMKHGLPAAPSVGRVV